MAKLHLEHYVDIDSKPSYTSVYYVGCYCGTSFHPCYTTSDMSDAFESYEDHKNMFPDRKYCIVTVNLLVSKFS